MEFLKLYDLKIMSEYDVPITDQTQEAYILLFNNNIIAYAIVSENNWLEHLFVAKSFRNHGIGQILLSLCIQDHKHLTLLVSPRNSVAIYIYKKHGFKHIRCENNANIMKN